MLFLCCWCCENLGAFGSWCWCVCSRLCVCVDSSSLDTISRGAWPFLIGRVTCLSDLVSVRAVKKKERNRKRKRYVRRETHTTPHVHTTTHAHTHTTPHAHTHNTTCTHTQHHMHTQHTQNNTSHTPQHFFIKNCNVCNACNVCNFDADLLFSI